MMVAPGARLGVTPDNHRVIICLFLSLNHSNKRPSFVGRSVRLHTWLLSPHTCARSGTQTGSTVSNLPKSLE